MKSIKLQATMPITVFIDMKYYGQKIEHTDVGKIPENRRERLSWKGCYYTIQPNEFFKFDRTNNWDVCYFILENGAEFKNECGSPNPFIDRYNVRVL